MTARAITTASAATRRAMRSPSSRSRRISASWRRSRSWPRKLAMQMPARDPQAADRADRRTLLAQVMDEAVKFYRLQLKTNAGTAARTYLVPETPSQRTSLGPLGHRLVPRQCSGRCGPPEGQRHRGRPDDRLRRRRQVRHGPPLRPLPRPDHLPDPRRARSRHLSRRPQPRPQRPRQIPERPRRPSFSTRAGTSSTNPPRARPPARASPSSSPKATWM